MADKKIIKCEKIQKFEYKFNEKQSRLLPPIGIISNGRGNGLSLRLTRNYVRCKSE